MLKLFHKYSILIVIALSAATSFATDPAGRQPGLIEAFYSDDPPIRRDEESQEAYMERLTPEQFFASQRILGKATETESLEDYLARVTDDQYRLFVKHIPQLAEMCERK